MAIAKEVRWILGTALLVVPLAAATPVDQPPLPVALKTGQLWIDGGPEAAPGPGLPDLAALVKKAMPAVVSIEVEQRPQEPTGEDPLEDMFERFYGGEPAEGLGAGFVIHSSGLVLTNAHVVEKASRIRVIVADGESELELPARVLGSDPETDIALLRVEADRPLPVLPLGNSDGLQVADWVVAIGNPFGLQQSVTFGIISQKGRTDVAPQGRDGYFDFIQTDAPMNPGSSGGPLLNLNGEVVAVNNAINASGQGIGFAVPINMAKAVVPQLARDGKVTRSWIGISVQDLTGEAAKRMGISRRGGVVVSQVVPKGPAARAGLEVGDVIVRFGDRAIDAAQRLRWDVACARAGTAVPIQVLRKGKLVRLRVTPTRQPAQEHASLETAPQRHLVELGLTVADNDEPGATLAGLPSAMGVRVVDVAPASPGGRAGLERGDVLLELGSERITGAAALARLIEARPRGALLELHVRRQGEDAWLALRKP
jgi:serine protease Do